jgi:hypothetical protein
MIDETDTNSRLAHTEGMEPEAVRKATWSAVEREIAADRGWLGTLRALQTPRRVALAAVAALAPFALAALARPEGLRLEHALLVGLLAASAYLMLASLGRARSSVQRAGVACLAALAPLGWALTFGDSAAIDTHAPSLHAARCFGYGALRAAPALLLAVLLSRTPLRSATELALLAGISGLTASLLLDVHCASRHLPHLLLGHASIGAAGAGVYAVAARSYGLISR